MSSRLSCLVFVTHDAEVLHETRVGENTHLDDQEADEADQDGPHGQVWEWRHIYVYYCCIITM